MNVASRINMDFSLRCEADIPVEYIKVLCREVDDKCCKAIFRQGNHHAHELAALALSLTGDLTRRFVYVNRIFLGSPSL